MREDDARSLACGSTTLPSGNSFHGTCRVPVNRVRVGIVIVAACTIPLKRHIICRSRTKSARVRVPFESMSHLGGTTPLNCRCEASCFSSAVAVDGAGNPRKLTEGGPWHSQLSPDGKRVAYMTQQAEIS